MAEEVFPTIDEDVAVKTSVNGEEGSEHANPGKPTSNMLCLMNVIKGNVGIGILAMPGAVLQMGLAVGTAGIMAIGFLATYCMQMLVAVSRIMTEEGGFSSLDYGATVECVFNTGPERFRHLAKKIRLLTNIFIFATQVMGCTAYLLFMASNLQYLLRAATGGEYEKGQCVIEGGYKMKIQLCEFIVLVALLPFLFVRNLHKLGYFTAVANLFTLFGIVVLFVYVLGDPFHVVPYDEELNPVNVWPIKIWPNLPTFFGMVLFAFEGINLVLPMRNKVRDQSAFDGINGILFLGMTIVATLYTAMGFYGYLNWGNRFNDVMTDCLPITGSRFSPLFVIVLVLWSLAIYVSVGLQIYVAIIITYPSINKLLTAKLGAEHFVTRYGEYMFRMALLTTMFALAASIPCLSDIFSLVGAFSGSFLALILPALLDMVVHVPRSTGIQRVWVYTKDICILIVGFAGFFLGTYSAVANIVDKLSHGKCLD